MRPLVILDAAAFEALDQQPGSGLGALLDASSGRGVEVRCAAVTLAEVCRGVARTRRIEAALRRARGGWQIEVVPTDERLAKSVGRLLHAAQPGSCHLADAHVVALCADAERAVVVTSDPDDIKGLAAGLPAVRILIRRP